MAANFYAAHCSLRRVPRERSSLCFAEREQKQAASASKELRSFIADDWTRDIPESPGGEGDEGEGVPAAVSPPSSRSETRFSAAD